MAMMLHQATASEPLPRFCKRQRQQMKTALNLLLGQDHYEAEPEESPSLDNEQTRQWQQWFELAAESRDPLASPWLVRAHHCRCQPPVR